jgi:hypothetical protein
VANNVLRTGVQSISDLINEPGLINVDFADVRTIMNETGGAVMGVGVGKGENRATEAVKKACSSPLLDKIVIDGARGVLICVTGGADMTLFEINEATSMVYEAASPDANIIFGAVLDDRLKDEVRVTIIATGFEDKHLRASDQRLERDDPRAESGLKAKLESMFSSEKKAAAGAAGAKAEPAAGRKAEAAEAKPALSDPTPAASALHPLRSDEPAPEPNRDADVLDFSQPGNPLRQSSLFAHKDEKPAPAAEPAPKTGEPAEDDLETPAFLRRRKNLFE